VQALTKTVLHQSPRHAPAVQALTKTVLHQSPRHAPAVQALTKTVLVTANVAAGMQSPTGRSDMRRAPPWLVWGLTALVVLVPLLNVRGIANPTTGARYAFLGVAVAVLNAAVAVTAGSKSIQCGRNVPVVCTAGYVSFALLSTLWAIDRSAAISRSFELATFFSIFLFAAWVGQTRTHGALVELVRAAAATGGLLGGLAIAQNFGFFAELFEQAYGGPAATFGNKNVLATYLGALLFPSLLCTSRGPRSERVLWTIPFALILCGLAVSRSRGAWLAAVVTAMIFAALCMGSRTARQEFRSLRPWPWPAVSISLAFAFAFALTLTQGPVAETSSSIFTVATTTTDSTISARAAFNASSLMMLREHPFGVGLGSWRAAYPNYATVARTENFSLTVQPWEAHSDPLEVLTETGYIGAILFAVALVVALHRAWRARARQSVRMRWTTRLLTLGIAQILVHSLVDFPLRRPASALLFWLWFGLIVGITMKPTNQVHTAITPPNAKPRWLPRSASKVALGVVSLSVIAASATSLLWHTKSFLAERELYLAQRAANLDEAWIHVSRAGALFPYSFHVRRETARIAQRRCAEESMPCDTALRALEAVLSDEPFQPRYLIDYGTTLVHQGALEPARRALELAARILPDEPSCIEGLADLEQSTGNGDRAKQFRNYANQLRALSP
jgi:O-antigen ligase